MAASLGRFYRSALLKPPTGSLFSKARHFSSTSEQARSRVRKVAICIGVAAGGLSSLVYALDQSVKAMEIIAHPPHYHWSFKGFFQSLDHASMRRGWEVYKNVCSACHSLEYVAFRHLVDNTHTEEEAKAIAEEYQIKDGPDDTGEYFMRPGKLSDYVPAPYPNEEAARAANNGAYPPDLSYIINARHNGENYVFSLLTGYCDPPAGIQLREGQNFNPYFPGGAIGMAPPIYDEVLEFEDGTPATRSQIAKDVVNFLMWSSNHEYDERQKMSLKVLVVGSVLFSIFYYLKRHKFSHIKTTKLAFIPKKYK